MENELSLNLPGELPSAEPPVQHGPRWVFFGSDGLRAGWSALSFLVIVLLLGKITMTIVSKFILHGHHMDPNAPTSPERAAIGEVVSLLLVLVASWIMARIEGRRLAVYGYSGRSKLARFVAGGVWGFVALSILVGTLWKTHLLAFDGGHLAGGTAWKYAFAWLGMFVVVGIFEESLLRGYLQYTLTRGIGFWWGALVMSILFGAIHGSNKGESPVGLFSAGAVGLVFCISLWYTGSLWWAIGFHATWDWAQTFFYGTPDSGMIARGHLLSEHPLGPLLWSGGPTGPEGSLYIVPLLLIMALAMWLWWRGRGVTTAYRQDV
ncbi:MAG TPA: CPBP family intramembrane glutamic endopeptidase [Acidobacteriaceae bacterium]|nr:CPBP family intramembrane glutamic endopeptidase [Acidobacteriaceae bacterium]